MPFNFTLSPQFQNVQNSITKVGTYTPNNDYLYLSYNTPAPQAPNFVLLFCSATINLTIQAGGGYMCSALPVYKVYSLLMPLGSTYLINGIYFEGRTSSISPFPMAQGVPVDYAFMAGQATIV